MLRSIKTALAVSNVLASNSVHALFHVSRSVVEKHQGPYGLLCSRFVVCKPTNMPVLKVRTCQDIDTGISLYAIFLFTVVVERFEL